MADETLSKRGGILHPILRYLRRVRTDASDAIGPDDELVVTRTADTEQFVIADDSEWRNWLRHGLMAIFWTCSGLLGIVGGVYLLLS